MIPRHFTTHVGDQNWFAKKHGLIASMRRKANYWGNAPTERFFDSLTRE